MLDFYYVLARINMVIFIVLFFMLMNKRGYAFWSCCITDFNSNNFNFIIDM